MATPSVFPTTSLINDDAQPTPLPKLSPGVGTLTVEAFTFMLIVISIVTTVTISAIMTARREQFKPLVDRISLRVKNQRKEADRVSDTGPDTSSNF
jgi:hypothetical protein